MFSGKCAENLGPGFSMISKGPRFSKCNKTFLKPKIKILVEEYLRIDLESFRVIAQKL